MGVYENFDEQKQFACRVIADHARSTAFAIADGILPGNEGRNYVLRKIMRRAIYNGREHLGFDGPFFHKVCDFVVGEMGGAFPELIAQRDFIAKMVLLEEERFGNTMTVGLKKLEELLTKNVLQSTIDGIKDCEAGTVEITEFAKLYDTYGLPIDLMHIVVASDRRGKLEYSRRFSWNIFDQEANKKVNIDEISGDEFRDLIERKLIEIQRTSEIGKTQQAEKINPIYAAMQRVTTIRSEFIGYNHTDLSDAKVIALVKDSQQVDSLNEGDEGLIVLDKTPFYAEAGGQVGDTGRLVSTVHGSGRVNADPPATPTPLGTPERGPRPAGGTDSLATVRVLDTFAPVKEYILHKSKIESGTIKIGDTVTASVDVQKRDATRRNHTATHLVHAALREVLGTHVKQAGSVVAPNYLRFDFTHYQPMSATEIQEIEDLVNRYILENHPVNTDLMSIEDAMRSGAMALFGEKYGGEVRVLSVGNGEFSRELCGGTHVRATGDIGSFKITNDEAIASGVRRIRAITGYDSLERFREDELLIERSLGALKTQRDNLPNAIEKLQEELKKTRKEMDELKLKIASGAIGGATANGDEAKDVAGIKLIAKSVEGLDAGGMRQLSDNLLDKMKSGVVVLGRKEENKVSIIVRVSDDLTEKIKAGNVIKELAPIIGGRGGGKPDMAEGGGNLPDKLSEAIDASAGVIEKMLV